ncbi:GTP-binding protein [Bacteroidota bacterium]
MKLIVVSGPPSVGKTSMLIHTLGHMKSNGKELAVVKLDCLIGGDEIEYRKHGIEAITSLSTYICPDHYLATNIDRIINWGIEKEKDFLIIESAGLCNRCSPYLNGAMAVAVMDMLSGMMTPRKVGPLLKSADIVILTRGDLISQAEREVFRMQVASVNKKAKILEVNGLTGQGTLLLANQFEESSDYSEELVLQLRYSMPAAVCSFCLGEKRVGETFASGNVRLMEFEENNINMGVNDYD